MDLKKIKLEVEHLVKKNGWDQAKSSKPQTAKNLAISLAIETSELLEYYQWNDIADKELVAGELADIIIFAAQISNVIGVDLDTAVRDKLEYDKKRNWGKE